MENIEEYTLNHPNMAYYRELYKGSKKWDKEDLNNKTVIIYGQMGHGDQIQFLRFIPFLKEMGCKIIVHTPKALHRLTKTFGVEVIDRDYTPLPEHDYHILSFTLPFLLNKIPVPTESYIHIEEKTKLLPGINIGIAWEGSHLHEHNDKRNCPLKYFKELKKDGVNIWCLQQYIYDKKLIAECEDFDLNGVEIEDFYDVAKLINGLDVVVSVDTAVLHLAGAMGKKGYGLLNPETTDPRWSTGLWYSSIKLIKGKFEHIMKCVQF